MKHSFSLVLALPLLLLGCGQPTTQEAEADLCTNLADLGNALGELSQIDANSEVRELTQAKDNVAKAYQSVQDAAATVEAARLNDLQTAYDEFDKTVNDISGRETVGEAATQVASSMANVRTAREQLSAGLSCPQ
jgi:hypothetical protein